MGGFRAAQKAVHAAGQAALPTKLCWRGCPRGLDFWRIPATRQEALEASYEVWSMTTTCSPHGGRDLGASQRCLGDRPWERCL